MLINVQWCHEPSHVFCVVTGVSSIIIVIREHLGSTLFAFSGLND